MPTYMGTLTLHKEGNTMTAEAALAQAASSHVQAPPSPNTLMQNLSNMLKASPLSALFPSDQSSSVPVTTSISSKRASWKPSGGKKLETGLAVVLENITAGFTHPNIMDVKLGARLWADDAPVLKRRKLDDVSKETTSGTLGFRIAGMKIWIPPEERTEQEASDLSNMAPQRDQPHVEVIEDYRLYNKNYGRSYSADNVKDAFIEYLGGKAKSTAANSSSLRFKRRRSKLIANRLIRELESVQFVLQNHESRMYSASILMVYEGHESALEAAIESEKNEENSAGEDVVVEQTDIQTMVNGVRGTDGSDVVAFPEVGESDDDDDEQPPKVQDVRLIDFAHAAFTPGQGPDENALQGVREVIRILREVVAEYDG